MALSAAVAVEAVAVSRLLNAMQKGTVPWIFLQTPKYNFNAVDYLLGELHCQNCALWLHQSDRNSYMDEEILCMVQYNLCTQAGHYFSHVSFA
jgi:hypothetical protein